MGLPEELYLAMLEFGYSADHHKIPGPLAHTLIESTKKSSDLWKWDEKDTMKFAAVVLAGPTNLWMTTGQLPGAVASVSWKLIRLWNTSLASMNQHLL